MPTLQIIIASTRPGRVGLPVAEWVHAAAVKHGGFDQVELVDLAEWNLPFMDERHHPRLRRYEHQHTRDWSATIDRADAFLIVMPEYNFGYTAPLKNAIDYLAHEWAYITHFYRPFYVYQYATSFTASTALAEKVMSGQPDAVKRYRTFLAAGGSKYPINLLKDAGVDMTTTEPLDLTIQKMNRVMDEIEKLLKN